MKDYIINSFIINDNNTILDIYNYIKYRYNNLVEINDVKKEISWLVKSEIIYCNNNRYILTDEGRVILNDNIYYYSKIIIRFYKKYNKKRIKYEIREVRQEQQFLRNYLINNKEHSCIICDKILPLCLLEAAHIKPRSLLNSYDKCDKNVVEFMCRYCHNLYDNGFLAVYKGLLKVSIFINKYDLCYIENKQIPYYNLENEKYFIFHYNYIYKKGIIV